MKKLLSLLVVLVMVTTLFAGCAKTEEATTETTGTKTESKSEDKKEDTAEAVEETEEGLSGTIVVLTNRTDLVENGRMEEYAAAFNAVYPDVEVEFEGITDYQPTVKIRMSTSEYGDVLAMPVDELSVDQLPDFFEPLGTEDDLAAKYLWVDEVAFDNTVYGIPSLGTTSGIVYNKEVFAAAGITETPATPEDFIAAMTMIKDNTEATPYYTNYAAGWPMGGQWESNAAGIAGDPDWQNTLPHTDAPWSEGEPYYILSKLLNDLAANGLTEEDPTTTEWEASKGFLARGEIGCMVLGSWSIAQMQAAAVAEGIDPSVIGYMPFPVTNADGNVYSVASSDYNYGVNKNSENIEAAKAFVQWFVDESGFAGDEGGIPPMIGGAMPDTLASFEEIGVVYMSNNPAPEAEETFLNDVDNEAEIGRWSDTYRKRILEAALLDTGETFEDIMADLNSRWAAARTSLGIN